MGQKLHNHHHWYDVLSHRIIRYAGRCYASKSSNIRLARSHEVHNTSGLRYPSGYYEYVNVRLLQKEKKILDQEDRQPSRRWDLRLSHPNNSPVVAPICRTHGYSGAVH